MRELTKYLKDNYRVIEFSSQESLFDKLFHARKRLLSVTRNKDAEGEKTIFLEGEHFTRAIGKNSADVIILNCAGWNELRALQKAVGTLLFFERFTAFNVIFLFYFLLMGIVTGRNNYLGLFYLRRGIKVTFYLGIKKKQQRERTTRNYLSPLVRIEDFFKELNCEKINYCILRWFENLPDIEVGEDIDLLIEDGDLTKIYSVIDRQPGIVPLDIYSKSGVPGSDYNNLPYYVFSLAESVLKDSFLYKDIFKVPTWENYFYLLAYHAVFHKGEASGITSNKYKLISKVKPDHDYLHHLRIILSKTNLDVTDLTLEGLHSFLDDKKLVPSLDTQYKLSLQNQYLKVFLEDFHNQSNLPEKFKGLICFVVREKIIEAGLVEYLKKLIQKHGFTIILSSQIKDSVKDDFTKRVRGGNWNRGPWPTNAGKPALLIVAFDVYPIKPTPEDLQQHPGLSNKRIEEKNAIRDLLNRKLPDRKDWCNGLHSSDNEMQAAEYLSLAGLNEEDIFNQIKKLEASFKTENNVIEVLSRYSKRAKVELIDYKGEKAIRKTFKPRCEWFLENEIKAYKKFKDLKEIPHLLETGDNYFITSFVEGCKPLNSRINIQTLKKCLSSLKKIYDRGYSLLDFQPANFLMDKKRNLYLIDFEFLHKYNNKPSFMECYDLVGIPENFDILYTPIIRFDEISEGMKQFDVLWGGFTNVYYDELLKLDDFSTYYKSFSRYYKMKIRKLLGFVLRGSKRGIKLIFRILPK